MCRQSNEQYFVNIADNLLKERKYVVDVENDEYLSDSVKNDFVFNEIPDSEVRIISKLCIQIKGYVLMSLIFVL